MKRLEINTDKIGRFKINNKPFENILIYGNTINRFGNFYGADEYGIMHCMDCHGKKWKRYIWLLKQIDEYKANVYIICNQKTIDYYQTLLNWMADDWFGVDISNVKLLKEGDKVDILEQFDTL